MKSQVLRWGTMWAVSWMWWVRGILHTLRRWRHLKGEMHWLHLIKNCFQVLPGEDVTWLSKTHPHGVIQMRGMRPGVWQWLLVLYSVKKGCFLQNKYLEKIKHKAPAVVYHVAGVPIGYSSFEGVRGGSTAAALWVGSIREGRALGGQGCSKVAGRGGCRTTVWESELTKLHQNKKLPSMKTATPTIGCRLNSSCWNPGMKGREGDGPGGRRFATSSYSTSGNFTLEFWIISCWWTWPSKATSVYLALRWWKYTLSAYVHGRLWLWQKRFWWTWFLNKLSGIPLS